MLCGLRNREGEEEDYLFSHCIGILIEKGVFNEGCWFSACDCAVKIKFSVLYVHYKA